MRKRGSIGHRGARRVAGIVLVSMALSGVFAATASANTKSNCVTDSSISFQVCMKMYYNVIQAGQFNNTYIQVTKYTATFTRLAPQGTLTNPVIHIGAEGSILGGGYLLLQSHEHEPSPFTLGNTYSWTPTWSADYLNIDQSGGFQCMNASATVHRGSESWALNPNFSQNVCEGQVPGPWF